MAKTFEMMFNIAARLSSGFTSAFSSASSVMARTQSEVIGLKVNLKILDESYKKGVISAQSYTNAHKLMSAELNKVVKAQERLGRAMSMRKSLEDGKQKFRDNIWNTAETALTVGAPVVAAMKFESAMADVRKVVDFDTPEQFKEMGNDITELSKRIPMAADELAKIVAAGGQSGIAREDLLKFAEDSAKMGVAFDVTAEQAGQMMAQWRTAFRMNQSEVASLADQINYLGNTTAASAPKISEVVTRIGPLGEIGGVAAGQIAALGATMVGVGIQEEIAATGIKNLVLGMVAGEGATKSQAEAFAALGLNAADMAKYMQEDAQGAILTVLKALQQLPKYQQASVLSDLFGKESIGAISPLLTNLQALEDNFAKVADKTKYAGSMQAEFDARSATTENKLQLMRNSMNAVGITLGNIVLPVLGTFAEKLSGLFSTIEELSKKYPNLTNALVLGVGGIMAATVTFSALGYIAMGLVLPFMTVWEWMTKIKAANEAATVATKSYTVASRVATIAQWLWNAALTANPIGLVIVGIAALIATGYLLYKNWDLIKQKTEEVWAAVSNWFGNAYQVATQFIHELPDRIAYGIGYAIGFIATLPERAAYYFQYASIVAGQWASALVTNVIGFLATLPDNAATTFSTFLSSAQQWAMDVYNSIVEWFMQIPDRILEVFNRALSYFDNLKNRVKNFAANIGVSFSAGATAGSFGLSTQIASNAAGGIYSKGAFLTTFAEDSAEAAIPLDGSPRALSLWAQAGEMLGVRSAGGTGDINVTFAPVIHATGGNVQEIRQMLKAAEDKLVERLEAIQRQQRRVSYA